MKRKKNQDIDVVMLHQKKPFRERDFIPRPARVITIIQLCIAFTILIFTLSYPFLQRYIDQKTDVMLIQIVKGDQSLVTDESSSLELKQRDLLKRNVVRFEELPLSKQTMVDEFYEELISAPSRSFLIDFLETSASFVRKTPSFMLAWILLSIVLGILILLKVEGTHQTIWLLPLLVSLYGWQNVTQAPISIPSPDAALFPQEKEVIEEELADSIEEQREQLQRGWQAYLVKNYAKEIPSNDKEVFDLQVEKGEFLFNIARIEKRKSTQERADVTFWETKKHPAFLLLFFFWNFYFAWQIFRTEI